MRILPGVCPCGFLCKAAVRVASGLSCKASNRALPGLSCKAAAGVLSDFSCKAEAGGLPGFCFPCECGSRASAPVPESYRHEFSFCASMCAFIRCQEHYHKSGISSTFLVFLLDFWAKSRVVLPKIFLWHQCFGRYFRNKAIFS